MLHRLTERGYLRAASNGKRLGKLHQVIAKQDDVGAFARHVSSRTHRDTYLSFDQGRRIVDAVVDHGDCVASVPQLPHILPLVFRQKVGGRFGEAQLPGYAICTSKVRPPQWKGSLTRKAIAPWCYSK